MASLGCYLEVRHRYPEAAMMGTGNLTEPERELVASRLRDRYGPHPAAITWTKAANQGAVTGMCNEGEA